MLCSVDLEPTLKVTVGPKCQVLVNVKIYLLNYHTIPFKMVKMKKKYHGYSTGYGLLTVSPSLRSRSISDVTYFIHFPDLCLHKALF